MNTQEHLSSIIAGNLAIFHSPTTISPPMRITKQISPRRVSGQKMTVTVNDVLARAARLAVNDLYWMAATTNSQRQSSLPSSSDFSQISMERMFNSSRPSSWHVPSSKATLNDAGNPISSPMTPGPAGYVPYSDPDATPSTCQDVSCRSGHNSYFSPVSSSPFIDPYESEYASPYLPLASTTTNHLPHETCTSTDASLLPSPQYVGACIPSTLHDDESCPSFPGKHMGGKDENTYSLLRKWPHPPTTITSIHHTDTLPMTSPPTPPDYVFNGLNTTSLVTDSSTCAGTSHECRVNDEKIEDEEELIGMGLYDIPELIKHSSSDLSSSPLSWSPYHADSIECYDYLENHGSRISRVRGTRIPSCDQTHGQGLKLEETWTPPSHESDDEGNEGEDESEDEDVGEGEMEHGHHDEESIHENIEPSMTDLWPCLNSPIPSNMSTESHLLSSQLLDHWTMK